jgi:CRISPR-associated protein Cmr5
MHTTRQQKMAEAAFAAVIQRGPRPSKEYASFAKSFPALIQTSGLCQAIAFAAAKGKRDGDQSRVLQDVFDVYRAASGIQLPNSEAFAHAVCTASVAEYLRFSRLALQAATWVKRYVEALDDGS